MEDIRGSILSILPPDIVKKLIPLVILAAATSAPAALIYESFGQLAGNLNGQAGGAGLNTWSDVGTVTIEPQGSLTYGNLLNSGGQARVVHSAGTDAFVTTTSVLADNNLLDDGATLWFSYVFRKDTGGGSNEKGGFAFGTERLDGAFNGTNMINSGNGLGVITNNTSLSAASWSGGGNGSTGGSHGLTYGDAVFVVGKIDWGVDGLADEQITLYTPSLTDLGTLGSGVTQTLSAVDQSLFDTISFTQRNSGGTDQFYDEIRFGSTYADVSPVIPEPAAAMLGSLGALLLLRRRRS